VPGGLSTRQRAGEVGGETSGGKRRGQQDKVGERGRRVKTKLRTQETRTRARRVSSENGEISLFGETDDCDRRDENVRKLKKLGGAGRSWKERRRNFLRSDTEPPAEGGAEGGR